MKKETLKKVVILALAICTILTIYACGGEKDVTMKLGEKTTVEGYVEFTPVNVLVSDKVFPPVTGTYPMGWTAKTGKTFVIVIADVKNLSDEAIKASSFCKYKLSIGEDSFNSSMTNVVTDEGTKLSSSLSIEAGKTETVYFVVEMDANAVNKETLAEFAFTKDDDEPVFNYKLTVDTTKPFAVVKKLELNKKISVDGLCELTPTDVKFTKKIVPSNPGSFYNYYQANGSNEKLLVVNMKSKNLSDAKKAAYKLYGVTAIYDGSTQIGGVVADDENKANIRQNEEIGAGANRTTYGVVTLSKKAEKAKCDLYIYLNGTYYQYTYGK